MLVAPHTAWAVTVHTVSAQTLEGKLTAITADGRLELDRGGKKSFIPLQKVFRIVVQDREPVRDPSSVVEVRAVNGTRLYGTLRECKHGLSVFSRSVGRALHFDVDSLLGVRFIRKDGRELETDKFDREMARPNKEADLLFVVSPKGIVPFNVAAERFTPRKIFFNWDGQDRSAATSKIAAVVFANSPADEPAPASVGLIDGSVLCGSLVSLSRGRLALDLAGTKASVLMANVLVVEITNTDIVYLSDLRPVEVKEIPFWPTSFPVWPHRLNKSTTEGNPPITLDGRKYEHGIGCHTKTVLTYRLGGRYKKFAAVIGIDDKARPQGSVEFVVKTDGKQIYSRTLTGRDKSVSIALDIDGAKRLTLIADYADEANTGDHADWADARVMK